MWRCRESNPGPRGATVQASTRVVSAFRVFAHPAWPADGLPDKRRLVRSRFLGSAGASEASSL